MAAIRSKGSVIEMQVRRALHGAGFRYRLHRRDLPGRPDITLPKYRLAVFVDGCFWHGHECIQGHKPKSNTAYWGPKIARNMERDQINRQALEKTGWRVAIVRECTIEADIAGLIQSIPAQGSAM
ncbi:MAG: very short patch repair endonuclease [Dehalococcoidia bacterium]|nr:very short patch repair endonuclease [Chloroflexi bacterium CFX7]NUQ55891.1 very short patch repair endonuclease [Dehalococcoidia bacterium]RIL02884.1 MAG: very short patch repair endonuclease [bacterium]